MPKAETEDVCATRGACCAASSNVSEALCLNILPGSVTRALFDARRVDGQTGVSQASTKARSPGFGHKPGAEVAELCCGLEAKGNHSALIAERKQWATSTLGLPGLPKRAPYLSDEQGGPGCYANVANSTAARTASARRRAASKAAFTAVQRHLKSPSVDALDANPCASFKRFARSAPLIPCVRDCMLVESRAHARMVSAFASVLRARSCTSRFLEHMRNSDRSNLIANCTNCACISCADTSSGTSGTAKVMSVRKLPRSSAWRRGSAVLPGLAEAHDMSYRVS